MARTYDNPKVPLPFVPPTPKPGETLSAHVANKSDPHETLKLAHQAHVVPFAPGDLSGYNANDLVIVHSSGNVYRVNVVNGTKSLVAVNLHMSQPLAGRDFDISTPDGITYAVGSIIEALGGTAHV